MQATVATAVSDWTTLRVYVDASWQPRPSAVALAALAAGSNEYSVRAYTIDSIPDTVNLELRAVQQGIRLARCIL